MRRLWSLCHSSWNGVIQNIVSELHPKYHCHITDDVRSFESVSIHASQCFEAFHWLIVLQCSLAQNVSMPFNVYSLNALVFAMNKALPLHTIGIVMMFCDEFVWKYMVEFMTVRCCGSLAAIQPQIIILPALYLGMRCAYMVCLPFTKHFCVLPLEVQSWNDSSPTCTK